MGAVAAVEAEYVRAAAVEGFDLAERLAGRPEGGDDLGTAKALHGARLRRVHDTFQYVFDSYRFFMPSH